MWRNPLHVFLTNSSWHPRCYCCLGSHGSGKGTHRRNGNPKPQTLNAKRSKASLTERQRDDDKVKLNPKDQLQNCPFSWRYSESAMTTRCTSASQFRATRAVKVIRVDSRPFAGLTVSFLTVTVTVNVTVIFAHFPKEIPKCYVVTVISE